MENDFTQNFICIFTLIPWPQQHMRSVYLLLLLCLAQCAVSIDVGKRSALLELDDDKMNSLPDTLKNAEVTDDLYKKDHWQKWHRWFISEREAMGLWRQNLCSTQTTWDVLKRRDTMSRRCINNCQVRSFSFTSSESWISINRIKIQHQHLTQLFLLSFFELLSLRGFRRGHVDQIIIFWNAQLSNNNEIYCLYVSLNRHDNIYISAQLKFWKINHRESIKIIIYF